MCGLKIKPVIWLCDHEKKGRCEVEVSAEEGQMRGGGGCEGGACAGVEVDAKVGQVQRSPPSTIPHGCDH